MNSCRTLRADLETWNLSEPQPPPDARHVAAAAGGGGGGRPRMNHEYANGGGGFVHSWGEFVDGGPFLRRTRDLLLPRLAAGEVEELLGGKKIAALPGGR